MRRDALLTALLMLPPLGFLPAQEKASKSYPPDKAWPRHTILTGMRGADGVRFADVDGDGLLDVATGWEEEGVTTVSFHPGKDAARGVWSHVKFPGTRSVEDAVAVDLDGDGTPDIVSCCEGKERCVYFSWGPADRKKCRDAAAWKTEAVPCTKGTQWMYAIPLQVDGKHGVDLIVGAKNSKLGVAWLEAPENPRDLAAWKLHPLSDAGWIMSLLARDMDGDGDRDVLLSDRRGKQRGVRWLENPGPGKAQVRPWTSHAVGAMGREVMFLEAADLDGDQLEDVVVNVFDRDVVLLRRLDGSGRKWSARNLPHPANCGSGKAAAVGDLDGDGKLDLVLAFADARKKSGIVWLPGLGKTDPQGFPLLGPRREISGLAGIKFDLIPLIDLDGDGDLDVVSTEETTGLGIVWYENPAR